VVSGWRKNRQDKALTRKLPSAIANRLISRMSGVRLHDYGCTLKAYRREAMQGVHLYGEMHRFIPILAHARGARCAEVVTKHHPRQFGQTKYGISRTFRVILDLITVKYLLDYFASPMKLFGMAGLGCLLMSLLAGVATVAMKLAGGVDLTGNPLVLLTVFALMVGIQFIGLGLLGELGARLYFGSTGKQHYTIRELINFNGATSHLQEPPRVRAA
jgi:hypothetical protein